MAEVLKVFISATSGDLDSVRELVKQGLLSMRCFPVEQTNFSPDYRELPAFLEENIRECGAVVHLVGMRYGSEPDPATLPPGVPRRSNTQLEADLARKLGKKLYVFLCPEDFPYDPYPPEPEELLALQRAYREEVARHGTLHTTVSDRHEVAVRIRELHLDLGCLREQQARHRRRTFGLASLFAVVLGALGLFVWWNAHRTPALIQSTAKTVAEAAVHEAISYDPVRIRQNLNAQIRQRAHEEIAKLDRVKDWKQIDVLEKTRDQQLADVDHFLEQMGQAFEIKEVSDNYVIASQLLAEKGVTEALQILEAKSGVREAKLEDAKLARDQQEKTIRKLLQEKLLTASLLEKDSQWDKAEAEYRTVVRDGGGWPAPRNKLAWLLYERGIAIDPAAGNRKLREAADLCRGTLAANPRAPDPQSWANTRNTLGTALSSQGGRAAGAESLRLLGEAVSAFREALEVRTREQVPQDWARTQNGLGTALLVQGMRAGEAEGQRLLGEAVTAYRAALEVYTRELPQNWARTQNNLGIALLQQGERADGAESLRLVGEAVTAHRAALEVCTREQLPSIWKQTKQNLARALRSLAGSTAPADAARYRAEAEQIDRELAAP